MGRYKFEYLICPDCGATVADNWYIRHVRSGCKIGASDTRLTPAAEAADALASEGDDADRRPAEHAG